MAEFRQNSKKPYEPPTAELEEGKGKGGTPSTRLPFGLCKRYGIPIQDGWTPRDAWNALKGIGIDPKDEYEKRFGWNNEQTDEKEIPPEKSNWEAMRDKAENRCRFSGAFTKQYFRAGYDRGNEDSKRLVDRLVNDEEISWSAGRKDQCAMLTSFVELTGSPTGEGTYYEDGGILWHETFHALDGAFIDYSGIPKGCLFTVQGASCTVDLDGHGTLHDILKSELFALKKEGRLKEIRQDYDALKDEFSRKANPDYDSIKKRYQDEDKKRLELMGELDAIGRDYEARYGWGWRYLANLSQEDKDAYERKTKEVDEQRDAYNEARKKYIGASKAGDKSATRAFEGISDMMSALGDDYIGMGHDQSYWRKSRYNRTLEFFAGYGSAVQHKTENYNNMKKYLPKSMEAAEKLFDMMKSGKLKTRKQQHSEVK